LLETISLDLEEAQELLFKVKVEGIDPAPAKVRLVCETGDVAYMFNGQATPEDGVVQFLLPALNDRIKEGLYPSRVEVLIENRYFAPVQFNIAFKKAVKVFAEAVQRKPVPQVRVTAQPIIVQKKPAPAPVAPVPVPKPVVEPKKLDVPKLGSQSSRKAAPPPARFNAGVTLRERFDRPDDVEDIIENIDDVNEDLIKELAQSFIKNMRTGKR